MPLVFPSQDVVPRLMLELTTLVALRVQVNMRCALCVVRCALCVVRCAFCVLRFAFCVVRCALCVVRCALYFLLLRFFVWPAST